MKGMAGGELEVVRREAASIEALEAHAFKSLSMKGFVSFPMKG